MLGNLGGEGCGLLLLKGLADGLAVHGALVVASGASNLGLGGGAQVSGQVVFGLGAGGVDDVVLSEETGDQLFLFAALSGGEGLNFADETLAAIVVIDVGDGVEVAVDLVESGGGLLGVGSLGTNANSGAAVSGLLLLLLTEVAEVLGGEACNVGGDGLLDDSGSDDTDGDSDGSGGGEEGSQGTGGEGEGAGAKSEKGEGADLCVGEGDGADEGGEECKDLGVHCESCKRNDLHQLLDEIGECDVID